MLRAVALFVVISAHSRLRICRQCWNSSAWLAVWNSLNFLNNISIHGKNYYLCGAFWAFERNARKKAKAFGAMGSDGKPDDGFSGPD